MLVIISDLHLSDGSSGATVSAGAFEIFADRLRDLAEAASWRTDGSYRPIEQVDLVLLGDILDVIRSGHWTTRPAVRPWGNPHAPEFVDQIARITADVLRQNEEALSVLRGLSGEGGLTVPPALRSARPAADAPGQPVPVRIHYMVGNHDWFYHLPGPNYNTLRQSVARQMGLANRTDAPFAHDIGESDDLLQAMRRHKVTARHGDLYDPFNFEGDRDTSSLGDAIVIELLSRFASEVETQLAEELPPSTLAGLRELDNIQPTVLIPVWLDGLLERTCPFPATRKRVKTVWDRLADEFLALDFVRQRDTWSPFDMVDGLEGLLKFSKRLSIGWASALTGWFNKIRGAEDGSYALHALGEQDFRNRRSKHIVYGHTHVAESVPLDASYAEGFVLNQMYFNSGTWRRLHRQTVLAPQEHEFIASDVMTYLAFFQGDERKGRPYETWSGTLAFHPSESAVYRLDRGKSSHATGQPVPSSGLSGHAPHFALGPVKPGLLSGRRVP